MRWVAWLLVSLSCACADTFVVTVGIETYDDPEITPVRYAVRDAAEVAQAFRQSGVTADRIVSLTSDAKDPAGKPTRNNLVGALDRVRGLAGADDTFVLFFAGHGMEREGKQYLLTSDTRERFVEDTALPMHLANRVLEGLQAGEILFLIDACRDDPAAARGDRDAALSDGLARGLRPKLSRPDAARPALIATLLACDIGQRAWADPHREHGVFTAALLEALGGGAAGADGNVTLQRLYAQVTDTVQTWCQRNGHEQQPVLLAPDGADMAILKTAGDPRVTVDAKQVPLREVVQQISQQTGIPIRIGQGVDAAKPITWAVSNQPLSLVLKLLFTAPYEVVREGGGYAILMKLPAADPPTMPKPPAAIAKPPAELGAKGQVGEARDITGLVGFLQDASYCTLSLALRLADIDRESAQRLKDWVRAGHRVVVGNDAAQIFGFTTVQNDQPTRMVLGVKPDAYALIRGVETINIHNSWQRGGAWFATSAPKSTSLLVDASEGKLALLAVMPLGQGEVVFRSDTELAEEGDHGALESNWSEYLSHFPRPQPGAGNQDALEVAGQIGEINHPNAVAQYIEDPSYVALIVHCDRAMFERYPAEGNALGAWVKAGHRMVLENDTAMAFGFTVDQDNEIDNLVTALKPGAHPLIRDVRALRVVDSWREPLWVCKGHPQGIAMIVDKETGSLAYLAIAPHGQGEIIFRPKNTLRNELDKGAFERNFDEYLASPVVPWTLAGQ